MIILKIFGLLVLWSFLGGILVVLCSIGETDWTSLGWHEDMLPVVLNNWEHPLHFSGGMWVFYFMCGPAVFIGEIVCYRKMKKNGKPVWLGFKGIDKKRQSKYRGQ